MHNLPTEKLEQAKPARGQRLSRALVIIGWLLVMAMSIKGMPTDSASVIGLILADITYSVGMVFLFRRV